MLLGLVVLSFGACKKNNNKNPDKLVFSEVNNATSTIKTDETIILNPKVIGPSATYEWKENDKVIGTTAAYVFQRDKPGDYVISLKVSNSSSTNSITYKIKVVGLYTNGILLINGTDLNGTGGGNISFLDENENLKLDVFSKENNGVKLSSSVMGAFRYGSELFVSATSSPFIQSVSDETLKLNSTITTSGITGVTYFATVDGKTGYVNSSTRRKLGFYAVDLTAKTIGSAALTGTADATLLPITTLNGKYLTPSLKTLVKVENGAAQTLFTYAENVAGVVKTSNKQVWVGVAKGASPNAKLIRLDENFVVQETVDLGSTFLLPPNGILTASGADEFIYWQETSTGDFCRFNTTTKTAEKFVSPAADGLVFATAWKVNPKTGELFLADSPGIFGLDDAFSDLYIYGKDKKLRKKIAKAGYQIVDVIFPK